MDKKIAKQWLEELKKFAKEPSYKHLRFPMYVESPKGDLLSPEGILCNLHAKATGKKWSPEFGVDKKLRSAIWYDGKNDVAPDSVLKWLGVSASTMCSVRRENAEGGFDAVIKLLETW